MEIKNGKKQKHKIWIGICIILLIGISCFLIVRNRNWKAVVTADTFTESAKELRNPNRGLYLIHGFRITDEGEDYVWQMAQRFAYDTDKALTMIQINLQYYRDRAISDAGLKHIEELFQALERLDKQLIIRFLYDWDGENEQYEPENIDIILEHMRQVEPILRAHSKQIFVFQGIFIGNWGEMNGTRYLSEENLRRLARQLAAVTDESDYLAVRMPAQWRKIVQLGDPGEEAANGDSLAMRLSLFNDGMLGNEGDYGTYGRSSAAESGMMEPWTREEELAFQEELCKRVPNGGEVINENPVNDFERAVKDLATMHVTYINQDYDQNVFRKWEETTIEEPGCFYGMDGYTFIQLHLGYRLLIQKAELEYDFWKDALSVDVAIRNVGYAPLYQDQEIRMLLVNESTGQIYSIKLEQDLRSLTGGNDTDQIEVLHGVFPLNGLEKTDYNVYFYVKDIDSGWHIQFANEQEEMEYGYRLGTVKLQ